MSRARCGDAGGLTKSGQPCRSTAVFPDTGRCLMHDETRAEERDLAEQLRVEAVREKVSICQNPGCRKQVKPGRRYCSDRCRRRAKHLRQQAGGTLELAGRPLGHDDRRGWVYDELLARGLMELLAAGAMRLADAAETLNCSVAAVSRAVASYQYDVAVEAAGADWTRPDLPELTTETVDDWVDAFIGFRETFFQTRTGDHFVTTPYMLRWVRHIFYALATGARRAILSPPRHGKTELLQHVAIFLICYRSNISIMWISKSEDVAKLSVRSIMDHLETNEALAAAFCPPGEGFRPRRGTSTKEWSPSGGQFTVATRTITGITSPTMSALSRTGTVRNRSADLIVCDDLEDHKSTREESQRRETRNFFQTEIESRKEDHTAWFVIGSRAHYDDLYHYLLLDPEWEVEVNAAHDPDCILDPLDEDIHVDCMMWPDVRTYAWLQQKFRSAEAAGQRDLAEMVYLNSVTAAGLRSFTPELTEPAKNPLRGLGPEYIPSGTNLIAGLDPSHTNYQAAFLWAYAIEYGENSEYARLALYMVDIENRKGGGIAAARESIAAWYEQYRLKHWVIEDNLLKGGIRQDSQLSEYTASRGIWLAETTTGKEKWDRKLGVTSLAPMFAQGQIDLPYLDGPAQAATNLYLSQLHHFSSDTITSGSKRPSDLAMASWFPLETMRFELEAANMEVESDDDDVYAGENYIEGTAEWF